LFFSAGIAGWLGILLYPVYSYIKTPVLNESDINYLNLGPVNEMENNSSKLFKLNKKPALLIKTEQGELKALSAVCTHMQCTVQYSKEEKLIKCPCHFGRYDLNGKNISGPPPKPLAEFEVILKDNNIIVKKQQV